MNLSIVKLGSSVIFKIKSFIKGLRLKPHYLYHLHCRPGMSNLRKLQFSFERFWRAYERVWRLEVKILSNVTLTQRSWPKELWTFLCIIVVEPFELVFSLLLLLCVELNLSLTHAGSQTPKLFFSLSISYSEILGFK